MYLYIVCASANIALILARCSSTTIDQYWKIVVFTNVGLWQLCSRPSRSIEIGAKDTVQAPECASTSARKGCKPMAGTTVVQATTVEESDFSQNGHRLPTWVSISSSCLDVRSHGYISTKKKIPIPGELYECVAVDCFVSNARVPEIAPRVTFGREFNSYLTGKTWNSPEIFVVSFAIPTEAPKLWEELRRWTRSYSCWLLQNEGENTHSSPSATWKNWEKYNGKHPGGMLGLFK